jgi:prepilin peptidase dependent protein B
MNRRKKLGFTLTELIMTLAINLIVLIALVSIFIANLKQYRSVININQLHQQLQSVMDIISNDIRRAGYWANASNDISLDQNNNPFMTNATDVTVNAGNNCILFTYDHNNNGSLPSISSSYDDERYGYRLNGQTLQTRPWGAAFDCAAAASAWENITNSTVIRITNLTFTLSTTNIATGPGTAGIRLRSVDITLTGQLASDSSVTKTLTQHIRIRNDKFIP